MRGYRQARWNEPIVYEYPPRSGAKPRPVEDEIVAEVGSLEIPGSLDRGSPPSMPALSETELVRHLTRLAEMSYGVDSGPVPLGSCTMKYNPRIALRYAYDERITRVHPLQDDETVQGILEIMYEVQEWLAHILGMDACTLHPAAGAHGELAGALLTRWYHKIRGQLDVKNEIIVPDSAHGTNPATASMAGFRVVEVPTGEDGNVDWNALESVIGEATAGLMITNPSTLGLFEERIMDIARLIREVDGILYYDGANLNGILGHARPGDMGFDVAHVNLHKTFSAPHGGGGPGSGPVCVKDRKVTEEIMLSDLLPGPRVVKEDGSYHLRWPSTGPVMIRAWQANTPVVVWAYIYMLALGAEGLRQAGELSVVNTNYFIARLRGVRGYSIPFGPGRYRKHEVVVSAEPLRRETGVTAEDVAKMLLDRGFHAPTIYFPLIVPEALMIEFTETETKENIDAYVDALAEIAREAYKNPDRAREAPNNTASRRVNAVKANHPRSVTPTWRVKRLRDEGVIGPLR